MIPWLRRRAREREAAEEQRRLDDQWMERVLAIMADAADREADQMVERSRAAFRDYDGWLDR